MELIGLKPRDYQKNILSTSINKNTLVVLPTGTGKTLIALLLTIERLKEYKNSKACFVSPTKPLCNQHLKTFQNHLKTDKIISLITGQVPQKKREEIYKKSSIIIATPQTIKSDLEKNRFDFKNYSLLIIDEAHRSRQRYANTIIAKNYIKNSLFPRILALTASPGSTKEKINEIKENLFIDTIEIRSEQDPDVFPYIPKKEIKWIRLELPEEYKRVLKLINSVYKEKLKNLYKYGITKPVSLINKKDLISLQKNLQARIKERDRLAFSGLSLIALLLKLNHASELLETQGINSFKRFIKKLEKETSRASKSIINNSKIKKSIEIISKIETIHPKLKKISSVIENQLKENPNSNIIVFANYRFTVDEIISYLSNFKDIKPIKLIGQKEGLTQKQQISIIKDFEKGVYNTLICTSIGEEGLDIKGCDTAIFYDSVPTSIRKIQRSGRVGRMKPGKIIFLLTKGTRDEGYYWISHRKEKKMKYLLNNMKTKKNNSL